MLDVATHPALREETAALHTLPRPDFGLTGAGHVLSAARPDGPVRQHPAVFAAAVARCPALAGLPAASAVQVQEACARWARLRYAVDAIAYPRSRADYSPGRGHVHNGACHCKDPCGACAISPDGLRRLPWRC
jgi:hypothetical protein